MPVFPCQVCNTQLSADEAQAWELVRCPTCLSTLRVPQPTRAGQLVGSGVGSSGGPAPLPRPSFAPGAGGIRGGGKRYGFNCPYCSSRLEAQEAQAAQDGTCPTCGSTITIPILDRYGRLIDPKTRQIIKQDPHPVHAYAAAGDRAPQIIRGPDGKQSIRCSRCGGVHAPPPHNHQKTGTALSRG